MEKNYCIAIAGNPNCGKSTLFNNLTGARQTIGNWPGVTVEKRSGMFHHQGQSIEVVDLPGIYSLTAHSEDEKAASDFILAKEADLIVNVVDSTILERSLYLSQQLVEMRIPMMIVLNMSDLADAQQMRIDADKLSSLFGCPVIKVCGVKEKQIGIFKKDLLEALKNPQIPVQFKYEDELENAINELSTHLGEVANGFSAGLRWTAVKCLERDPDVLRRFYSTNPQAENILTDVQKPVETILGEDADILIAEQKYAQIQGIMRQVVKRGVEKPSLTEKIDRVLLDRFLSVPLFLLAMYLVFWITINFGGVFIDFFDILFGSIFVDGSAYVLDLLGSPDWLKAILSGGIGAGIQTLSTFIPVMAVMFFILSLLEDSGYMARAAFIVDRFMRIFGLPGKAFIPMMVGFGCTVPAIMATRTMENKKDRFMTIFMAPFMSCGARLPVYILFAAAFFPENGQNVVFALYLLGIILALLTGLLLKKTIFRGDASPFILELPHYHKPRLKHILRHTFMRLKEFIVRAGKVLIVIMTFLGVANTLSVDGKFGAQDSSDSVLASVGKMITPAFEPMGIHEENWPATVSLFTGIFAKEMVVGTLSSLYGQQAAVQENATNDSINKSIGLEGDSQTAIAEDGFGEILWQGVQGAFAALADNFANLFQSNAEESGGSDANIPLSTEDASAAELGIESGVFTAMRAQFSINGAIAYLIFILLYVPCMVATAAAKKEMGTNLTWFQVYYTTMLAWVLSTLFFQFSEGGSVFWISVAFSWLALSIFALNRVANRLEKNQA